MPHIKPDQLKICSVRIGRGGKETAEESHRVMRMDLIGDWHFVNRYFVGRARETGCGDTSVTCEMSWHVEDRDMAAKSEFLEGSSPVLFPPIHLSQRVKVSKPGVFLNSNAIFS